MNSDSSHLAAPSGQQVQAQPPSLKKFNATIKLTTNSGARLEYTIGDTKVGPHKAILGTIGELVRLASVAGLEADVRREVEERIQAVADWRAAERAA